jgi:hypothetical protein
MTKIENGERVWMRGAFAKEFSIRGQLEAIDCRAEAPYGIRLENGDFMWVRPDQVKGRVGDGSVT